MQLPPLRDLQLQMPSFPTSQNDQAVHHRRRLVSTGPRMMDCRPSNRAWRETFGAMVDASLHEAEDIMLSLPYTHIRQLFARLLPNLETVQPRNMVRWNQTDPASVLVDVDFTNIVASEQIRLTSSGLGNTDRGGDGNLPLYCGRQERTSRSFGSEMIGITL